MRDSRTTDERRVNENNFVWKITSSEKTRPDATNAIRTELITFISFDRLISSAANRDSPVSNAILWAKGKDRKVRNDKMVELMNF